MIRPGNNETVNAEPREPELEKPAGVVKVEVESKIKIEELA